MQDSPNSVDKNEVEKLVESMVQELQTRLSKYAHEQILMIGIHTGGVWIAERMYAVMDLELPMATLDISFYRDDFSRIGLNPQVKPSKLPVSVDAKHIVLIDDILHTGRTIRAAMNEIFDYGRPASITLAVLGERSGRELPIQADVVGKRLKLDSSEHVKLSGPQHLELTVSKTVSKTPT